MKLPKWQRPSWTLLYAVAFFGYLCVCQFLWPVRAPDCDIWSHLNAGRYIWEHGHVPVSSFFSFLTPPRKWPDYYWLFQVIVYALHSVSGYLGLVALRACLYCATILGIGAYLFKRDWPKPKAYACFVFALFCVFLLPRFLMVRPHLFSYFFIVSFLYILEYRPRWAPALPLLAALWGNLHGVYAPILLFIIGSYAAEQFVPIYRARAATPDQKRILACMALCAPAFFLTPLGTGLLSVPFAHVSSDYINRHVTEVKALTLKVFSTISIQGWVPDHATLGNFIIFLAILSLAAGFARRRLRASHALLFLGATFLLPKLRRFEYEYALLAMPLLNWCPPLDEDALCRSGAISRVVLGMLAAAFMAMPWILAYSTFLFWPKYPLSSLRLPHGTVSFLNDFGGGGSVLNDPSVGGYLEWALKPSYKIGIDMQLDSHFFDENDFYLMRYAFADPKLFQLAVSRYRPEFVLAMRKERSFKAVAPYFSQYVPVFFDDTMVLYADRTQRPAIAAQYALPIDPYDPPGPGRDRTDKEASPCGVPRYLARMLLIDPHIMAARALAADFCEANGDFKSELEHGESIVGDYPEIAMGYLIEGAAWRRLGQPSRSLEALRRGLRRDDGELREHIMREMCGDLVLAGRLKEAVKLLWQFDPLAPPPTWAQGRQEFLSQAR
jgi:hypothetical protein